VPPPSRWPGPATRPPVRRSCSAARLTTFACLRWAMASSSPKEPNVMLTSPVSVVGGRRLGSGTGERMDAFSLTAADTPCRAAAPPWPGPASSVASNSRGSSGEGRWSSRSADFRAAFEWRLRLLAWPPLVLALSSSSGCFGVRLEVAPPPPPCPALASVACLLASAPPFCAAATGANHRLPAAPLAIAALEAGPALAVVPVPARSARKESGSIRTGAAHPQ
jgi:hypothetical protein